MKTNVLILAAILLFLAGGASCAKDDPYYYAYNGKIYLDQVPNRAVLTFDGNYLSETEAYLQNNDRIRYDEPIIVDRRNFGYCILTIENPNVKALREEFSKQVWAKSVNPLYVLRKSDAEQIVTDEIVVRFKNGIPQWKIDEMLDEYRVKLIEHTELSRLLSVPVDLDPLEIANIYQRSGLVEYSHPAFIVKIEF